MPCSSSARAHRLAVVDDQTEVTLVVGGLSPARAQREELVAEIDERHRRADAAPQLEVDQARVPGERLVDVADLEGDVVDPDRPRAHDRL